MFEGDCVGCRHASGGSVPHPCLCRLARPSLRKSSGLCDSSEASESLRGVGWGVGGVMPSGHALITAPVKMPASFSHSAHQRPRNYVMSCFFSVCVVMCGFFFFFVWCEPNISEGICGLLLEKVVTHQITCTDGGHMQTDKHMDPIHRSHV